jgi:uncharacterized Zn finger protein (UPF0148 family)
MDGVTVQYNKDAGFVLRCAADGTPLTEQFDRGALVCGECGRQFGVEDIRQGLVGISQRAKELAEVLAAAAAVPQKGV